jgi:hypothetical protein
MRYRVQGVSRSTGAKAMILVQAKDHDAARTIANRQLIVESVEPEGGLAEPEVFERPEREGLEELTAAVQMQAKEPAGARAKRSGMKWSIITLVAGILVTMIAVLLALWIRRN